jgi:hypothetical protein
MMCPHIEWSAEVWPKPVARWVIEGEETAEPCHTIRTCRQCGQRKVDWS